MAKRAKKKDEKNDARVREIVARILCIDESEVTPDSSFVEDLSADSLDVVEIVMEIEAEFGIEIDDEAAHKLTTLQSLLDYLE